MDNPIIFFLFISFNNKFPNFKNYDKILISDKYAREITIQNF